jgi:hypothetical protein
VGKEGENVGQNIRLESEVEIGLKRKKLKNTNVGQNMYIVRTK